MRSGIAKSMMMIWLAASLACDGNLGSVESDEGIASATDGATSNATEGETATEDEGSTGDDETLACIGGKLCPEGTSCSNGVCETECSSDDNCDGDEFCGHDGVCHPEVVSGCNSDQDCAPTQTCMAHVCVASDDEPCDLDDFVQDGCPSNAVCYDDLEGPEEGFCHPMSACDVDQTCPIGPYGAVCNTGQLPEKDEICLIGLCDVVANCPEFWSCVRYDNSVLGVCSDGGFGAPCSENEHCLSSNCLLVPGVGGGFCG